MKNAEIVKVHLIKPDGTISVVIPKKIRLELNIKSGDHLFVTLDKRNRLIYKKVGD